MIFCQVSSRLILSLNYEKVIYFNFTGTFNDKLWRRVPKKNDLIKLKLNGRVSLFDYSVYSVVEKLGEVEKQDPAKALDLMLKMSAFVLPKYKLVESKVFEKSEPKVYTTSWGKVLTIVK